MKKISELLLWLLRQESKQELGFLMIQNTDREGQMTLVGPEVMTEMNVSMTMLKEDGAIDVTGWVTCRQCVLWIETLNVSLVKSEVI